MILLAPSGLICLTAPGCAREDRQSLFKLKAKSFKLTPLTLPNANQSSGWKQTSQKDSDPHHGQRLASNYPPLPPSHPSMPLAISASTLDATPDMLRAFLAPDSATGRSSPHTVHSASTFPISSMQKNISGQYSSAKAPMSAHPDSTYDGYLYSTIHSPYLQSKVYQQAQSLQNLKRHSHIDMDAMPEIQHQKTKANTHQQAINISNDQLFLLQQQQQLLHEYQNNDNHEPFGNTSLDQSNDSKADMPSHYHHHHHLYHHTTLPQLSDDRMPINIHSAPLYPSFPDLALSQAPILLPVNIQPQSPCISAPPVTILPQDTFFGNLSSVALPRGPVSFIPVSSVRGYKHNSFHAYHPDNIQIFSRHPYPYVSAHPSRASKGDNISKIDKLDVQSRQKGRTTGLESRNPPARTSLQRMGASGFVNKTVRFTQIQNPYIRRTIGVSSTQNGMKNDTKNDVGDKRAYSEKDTDLLDNQSVSRNSRKRPRIPLSDSVMSSDPEFYGFTSLSSRTTEASVFNKNVQDFLIRIGKQIDRVPYINRKALNLWALFHAVLEHGGSEHVTKNRKWKCVGVTLRFPVSLTSSSYTLRTCFDQFLYEFERQFLTRHAGTPMAHYVTISSTNSLVSPLMAPSDAFAQSGEQSQASFGPMPTLTATSPSMAPNTKDKAQDPISSSTQNSASIGNLGMSLHDAIPTVPSAIITPFKTSTSQNPASMFLSVTNKSTTAKPSGEHISPNQSNKGLSYSHTPTRMPELSTSTTPTASASTTTATSTAVASTASSPISESLLDAAATAAALQRTSFPQLDFFTALYASQ